MTTKKPTPIESFDPKKILSSREKLQEQLETVESEAVIAAVAVDEQIKQLKRMREKLHTEQPSPPPPSYTSELFDKTERKVDWSLVGFIALLTFLFGVVSTAAIKS